MKKVSLIVVGAGGRGSGYARYARDYPDEAEIVAVCEPRDDARLRLAEAHGISADRQFRDWQDIVNLPKLADAVMICTQDAQHRDPAVALAGKGYHVLLEKPMAPNPEDCQAIYDAVKHAGVMLAVCHVLRYTAPNRKLKQMIDSGVIGKIRTIDLVEPVGYWHQAHSFVRGSWRNEQESSFMLLAKSCHDLDLLNYLVPARCTRVASFGDLSYFARANQPKGAADRCVNCPESIESACAYSAIKIYLKDFGNRLDSWPVSTLTHEATPEAVKQAITDGPYGRCAFACDNDVVDHQVVVLEFEGGATTTFTMSAFNQHMGREMFIMGDQGSLRCSDAGIEHFDFLTNAKTQVSLDDPALVESGHGGGDYGLMRSFLGAVRDGNPELITTGPDVSLQSHLIVFAAEHARRTGTVVAV